MIMRNKENATIKKWKKKFKLSIFNQVTLQTVFAISVSRFDGFFVAFSIFLIVFFISLGSIIYTPFGALVKGGISTKERKEMINVFYKVDSLSDVVDYQSEYITSMQKVMAGTLPIEDLYRDSLDQDSMKYDSLSIKKIDILDTSEEEKKFRKQYEDSEKYNLSVVSPELPEIALLFYSPVVGDVINKMDLSLKRYGVSVKISHKQPILSVLDGVVIFTGYTSSNGYIIQIQHENNYVSVYKNVSEVIKNQGDLVEAGEAIGIVELNEEKVEKHPFKFELWYQGKALNPTDYMTFN